MASLSIELESKEKPLKPGETVRGTVSWQGISPQEELEIVLLYRTDGVGTLDIEEIDSLTVPSPASSGRQSFAFKLPEGPYSFEGSLISLIWAIEAASGNDEVDESVEFVLSPFDYPIRLHRDD